MEESFDQVEGVKSTVSGYWRTLKKSNISRRCLKILEHVEAIEITYDSNLISYDQLLEIYWKNIDPFDSAGQFCDKEKAIDQ